MTDPRNSTNPSSLEALLAAALAGGVSSNRLEQLIAAVRVAPRGTCPECAQALLPVSEAVLRCRHCGVTTPNDPRRRDDSR